MSTCGTCLHEASLARYAIGWNDSNQRWINYEYGNQVIYNQFNGLELFKHCHCYWNYSNIFIIIVDTIENYSHVLWTYCSV